MLKFFLALLLALPAAAQAPHPYADAVRRRIATAQDERNTAGLLPFLTDKNPVYRAAAAEAFGSVQDKKAVPTLLPLLADTSPAVRRAAAYALGQMGDSTAVPALVQRLGQLEPNAPARRAAYEALGRCVTKHSVSQLWKITPPGPDSAAAPGRAWGLYRATLRVLGTAEAVGQATNLLGREKQVLAARRGASAALARVRGQDSALARVARPVLLKHLSGEADYYVRANCATALGRVGRPGAYQTLAKVAGTDADFRVQIAALRMLPNYQEKGNTVRLALAILRNSKLAQLANTAAETCLKMQFDTSREYASYPQVNRLSTFWRARATLLQAGIRQSPSRDHPAIADTIRRRYQRTGNQYEKAALLTALSEDPAQFDFLAQKAGLTTGPPVVPGAALAALVELRGNKQFPAARQADFTAALRRALEGGDVAQLSTVAEAYANPALVPAPQVDDLIALNRARNKLTLPREIEPWLALQQTLDKLEKAPTPTPAPIGPASQHPIDWALVQSIPVGQRVRIATTQGVIVLELKVTEAPGSVASFVSLVQQHFYDGLYFHRVVPDFVAQGGDPRGDGSGSTPYTLRSEFSPLSYGEGAVGLASAGKDTESCQFFFTHQPTPHLDGRYTIFAQVVGGMDVVQRLEIGDKMLTLALLPPPAGQKTTKKQ